MSIIKFPENPEHGMLFELAPGILYQYNKGSNCWRRLRGSEALGLATPLASGLMSKEDFSKLQNLIVPPPQATLKGEECNTSFKSGLVGLHSFDGSVDIKKNLRLTNKSSKGTVEKSEPWVLHNNTAGFDFRVALSQLIEEVENRNQLKKVQLQGDTGPKGPKGPPGVDRLDTGPVGVDGLDGVNSPFVGTVIPESIPFELSDQTNNKAIVDITSEEISEDENYLVLTRANIGNPDACPSLVIPEDFQSFLLASINTIAGGKLVRNRVVSAGGDCSLICRICASSLHHVNVEPILIEIFEKFKDRANRLKTSKEELVRAWLHTMVNLFNEQKAALCCALENCQSRKRNEKTRQYIETQKVQAAQGGFGLAIDGAEDRKSIDMDHFKDCPVPISEVANIVTTETGVTLILDSKIHIIDPRAGNQAQSVTAYLPPGTYQAEITGCCAQVGSYSGRAAILYQAVKSIGDETDRRESISTNVIAFPNLGTFETATAAKNAYQGLSLTFEHGGGNVSAWILDPDGLTINNDGFVTLTITNIKTSEATDDISFSAEVVHVYRDGVDISGHFGKVLPLTGGLSSVENLDFLLSSPPDKFNIKDKASFFLYNGSDGVSLFFLAGAIPGFDNDQIANIEMNIEITNNPFAMSVLSADSDANVKQLSPTQFKATVVINKDNSGFVIGPIDTNSDYSITINDSNFSTMQLLIIADAESDDIVLAEGLNGGIGDSAKSSTLINTAPLFDVGGVPIEFGGGNTLGLQLDNLVDGQNVIMTRPVSLDVPIIFVSSTPETPETSVPPFEPAAEDPFDIESIEDPVIESESSIESELAALPRGTTGSLQDPYISGINLTINTTEAQSLRYVMTDSNGTKFYSAFIPTNIVLNGLWQFLNLGPAISIIDPPPEFTADIINSKTLDLSLVEDKLTPQQLRTADSLTGISRLTFVQSIIGTIVDIVPDGRFITDLEIEFHKMPSGFVLLGNVTANVGVPGAITETAIDNFGTPISSAGLIDPLPFNGAIKRVLNDSSNGVWAGLANYFKPEAEEKFYSLARSIDGGRTTQISIDRGYRSLSTNSGVITAPSGAFVGEDNILVDDFGGVIVADGAAGEVFEVVSSIGSGADDRIVNQIIPAASGLNNSDNPVMEFGALDGSGNPTIVANFNGQWYRFGAPVASGSIRGTQSLQTLAAGPGGNSIAADRDVSSNHGNNFNFLFSLDANKIYRVDPNTGIRKEVFTLPEAGFGLKIHPITKDFYYITDDLGTTPRSGTRIKRVVQPAPIVSANFVDSTLSDDVWTLAGSFLTGPGGTISNENASSDGNPGSFRKTFHGHNPASLADKSNIISVHIQEQSAYDPSALGFIDNINFAVDVRQFAQFGAARLAIRQNGLLYATFTAFGISSGNWASQAQVGLTVTDFGLLGDDGVPIAGEHPDFSIDGEIIYFGYYLHSTHNAGFSNGRTFGFDNWNVEVMSISGYGLAGVFAAADGDAVYSISFGHTVPESEDRALYALMDRKNKNSLVEIGIALANRIWTTAVTGGKKPNPDTWIFTRIPPGGGCQMHYKQVQWYERGWRIGACCGALVEFGGAYYIVVKRSVGADVTCGGGESASTPCIAQFVDAGIGHPAIAWPTTPPDNFPSGGGDEFLGLPTSGFVNFIRDESLSDSLLEIIQGNAAIKTIGDPTQEIPFILFPSS